MPRPIPSAGLRTRTVQIVLFLAFAFWLPSIKGTEFLNSVILGAYACLGVVFAAPAAAEKKTVVGPVLSGLAWSWSMLLVGILTVYATRSVVVGPDIRTVFECGLFGAALATATSALVALIARVTSSSEARVAARVILLVLLVLFFFYSGRLREVALAGAAISATLAALLLLIRRRLA